jgi:predicted lipoprotein with Yx(FWY)xxD motif
MNTYMTFAKRLAAVGLLAAVLAGCGSSQGSGSSAGVAASGSTGTLVSVTHVDGVGNVLTDGQGAALYSPQQEADGMIRCTGSCAAIWVPLTLPAGETAPTGATAIDSKLGTVQRPDGRTQVTFDGKPLYSFVEDTPGAVTGNGLTDRFDGTSFTWHAAAVGPISSTPPSSSSGGSGAYGY